MAPTLATILLVHARERMLKTSLSLDFNRSSILLPTFCAHWRRWLKKQKSIETSWRQCLGARVGSHRQRTPLLAQHHRRSAYQCLLLLATASSARRQPPGGSHVMG